MSDAVRSNNPLSRRQFVRTLTVQTAAMTTALASGAGSGLAEKSVFAQQSSPADPGCPVVDTHTHFYDPSRPEGVPWPGKDDPVLYRTVLPAEFEQISRPHGCVGTVVVEASPRLADNDWLLQLAAKNPFLLGVVGNLTPGSEMFPEAFERLAAEPKYRGFRISEQTLRAGLQQPRFLADCRTVAKLGLVIDVNGGPTLLPDVAALANKIPDLTIVINHLANVRHDGKTVPEAWQKGIEAAARAPKVFCKVSALVESTGLPMDQIPLQPAFYRPIVDVAVRNFGEKRLMFGSDWPVSARYANYPVVQKLITDYFRPHGPDVLKQIFADNAQAAYRWPQPKKPG